MNPWAGKQRPHAALAHWLGRPTAYHGQEARPCVFPYEVLVVKLAPIDAHAPCPISLEHTATHPKERKLRALTRINAHR